MTYNKMDEIILVAERALLFEDETLKFQGTLSDKDKVTHIMRNLAEAYKTMRRGDAEENPAYKQPIPYAIIKREDEYFVYERLSGGGEKRLHNKLSLGAGGHVNDIEGKPFEDIIRINLERELDEELDITATKIHIEPLGLINDDLDEVGKVHLGILAMIELDKADEVTVRETDQLRGQWMTLDELTHYVNYNRLENWSQIVVDILVKDKGGSPEKPMSKLVKGLYKTINEMNATNVHFTISEIFHDPEASAVLSVYKGEQPANLVIDSLVEWLENRKGLNQVNVKDVLDIIDYYTKQVDLPKN